MSRASSGAAAARPASDPLSHKRALEHAPSTAPLAATSRGNARTAHPPRKRPRDASSHAILVSTRQRGNSLLKHLTNVPWEFTEGIDPDYIVGRSSCVLYLSLKFHMLHPKYILVRMGALRARFRTRVLLLYVDKANDEPLQEVTRLAFVNQWTLLCAWSAQECAKYVAALKCYENKPADILKKKIDPEPQSVLSAVLKTVRSVNSTDVATLITRFGSCEGVMNASMEELALCPGIGPKKVLRIFQAFRQPLRASVVRRAATVSASRTAPQDVTLSKAKTGPVVAKLSSKKASKN